MHARDPAEAPFRPGLVLLMRGLPGSGKSTVARRIAASVPGAVVVSADEHMFHEGRTFSLERLGDSHRRAHSDLRVALRRRSPLVVVDNTHLKAADAPVLDSGYDDEEDD